MINKKSKTPRLQKTTNYERFPSHKHQRSINEQHVRKLTASMKNQGFIPSFPITIESNGSSRVLDGHHRIKAAKLAGVPIYFVEVEAGPSISEINASQKNWTATDYLMSYVRAGNKDYIKVYNWVSKYRISIGTFVRIMVPNGMSGFAAGRMRTKSEAYLKDLCRIRDKCEDVTGEKAPARLFYAAHSFKATPTLSVDRLLTGLSHVRSKLKAARDTNSFLAVFEEGYNYSRSNRLPLVFMVAEATKERAFITKKKTPAA